MASRVATSTEVVGIGSRLVALLVAGALPVLVSLPARAGKAHSHGVAQVVLTLEGPVLSVELEMPLDTLVGFERAPRTESERQSARQALSRLRDSGASLIRPAAAGQCRLESTSVNAPVLEQGAAPLQGHADAQIRYQFQCAQPSALVSVELNLFEPFRRLERLEAQAVTESGQGRTVLRRAANTLRLPR